MDRPPVSSRNTCHQILIAAGRPGLAAVDERGVLLQELFAVGWDICGSFTRPQNAARRVRNGLVAGSENSLLIRENTRNFADFDPASPIRRPKLPLYLVAYLANSLGNRT